MNLEEQSLLNLVAFYSDELREVMNGAPADTLGRPNIRKTLTKRGIIKLGMGYPPRLVVTSLGREILSRLEAIT